ncbi:O-6-alkylguanine-DNA alkyltransferase [Anticarsia gemmatalis]|uniref:O-6-alkylguanine-DNA alkyltransferase n=1 Tax=Anticarsia gemmatalis TaxID=129554 RepID=UPI003F75F47C
MSANIINNILKLSKSSDKVVNVCAIDSSVGKAFAAADDDNLYIVTFEDSKSLEKKFEALSKELSCKFVEDKNKIIKLLEKELNDYLDGKLKKFTVPIKSFGSEFQNEVWDKLLELPYGSTQTYGDVAKALGRPGSHSRAVGAACGANPLAIIVPCHRLIASNSKGGYNSGVDRKEKLLELENKYSN